MLLKEISAETNQGPYLQLNEDGYDFDLNDEIFIVLDGFGGSGIGDRVQRSLIENIKKFYTRIAEDIDATMPFYFSPRYLLEGNALINSCLYSHNLVYSENSKLAVGKRGGASGVIAVKAESILTLFSVGNCVAYLYRHGKMEKLFVEDSFQLLSNDEYNGHLKSMPLSGFGLFPDLYYQIKEVRIAEGDKVILLTDGAYSRLHPEEIKDIITNDKKDIREKIQMLFNLANSRGNLDNQTTMVLEF